MPVFDTYVIVDWSSSNRPKTGPDSVWIGAGGRGDLRLENPPTRARARERVTALLRNAVAAGERVLVGFDFPYGYPRGLASALPLPPGPAWLRVWQTLVALIVDDEANESNRFTAASALNERLGPKPGPFWMRPAGAATPALPLTRPSFPYRTLAEYRATERALKRRGRHPQSGWKLSGAGSVGSQALLGIPVLHALRFHPKLAPSSRVWPFETGFRPAPVPTSGPFVLHAEIWPGIVDIEPGSGQIRDAQQVGALVEEFVRLDSEDALGSLFAPHADGAAASEEGWILGA
ncbi:MAG: hypothetical protein M3304_10220 [Actinomycetota bacterium]|nr:hypothetical protein [Actinomycetota bacterium]